jgi:hypothetical protein
MKSDDWSNIIGLLLIMCILTAALFGYGDNIYKLATEDLAGHVGLLALRIIGIFVPPVGVIVGYL